MSDVKITEEQSEQLDSALRNAIERMSVKELKDNLFDEMIFYYEREAPETEVIKFIKTYGNEFNASLTGKDSPCK